jgi:hypothetical protein
MNMCRAKRGRMFQKSAGPICKLLGNSRLKSILHGSKTSTFALLERVRKIARKSVEPKCDADWTSSFAPRSFAQSGVQKSELHSPTVSVGRKDATGG